MAEIDPAREITRLVQEHWRQYHRPILYAALGGRLSAEARASAIRTSKTLSHFIQQHLHEVVRHLHFAAHGGGAVPRAETASLSDEALEQLIPPPVLRAGVIRTPPGHYFEDVWKAFSTPAEGRSRFLEIGSGTAVLREASDASSPPPDWKEVRAEHLPFGEDGVSPTASQVADAIRAWAGANNLTPDNLRPAREAAQRFANLPIPSQGESVPRGEGLKQLELFLESLTPAELQGFSLSGTVLLSVIRRS